MSRQLSICIQEQSRLSHCWPAIWAPTHAVWRQAWVLRCPKPQEDHWLPTPPERSRQLWSEYRSLLRLLFPPDSDCVWDKELFTRPHLCTQDQLALITWCKASVRSSAWSESNKGPEHFGLDMLWPPENLEVLPGGNTLSWATSCSSVSRWLHSSSWASVWERQSHAFKEKITWITL